MSTKKIKLFLNDPELSQKCTFEKHTFDTPCHYDPQSVTIVTIQPRQCQEKNQFIFNLTAYRLSKLSLLLS